MQAAMYERAGSAGEVLSVRDVPEPVPAPGEVRVRIHYSAVNPTDWKRRSSEPPLYGPFQIPNQDGSGIIDQVGHDVDPGRLGQRVWVFHAAIGHEFGTAAEFVCIPSHQAVELPDSASMEFGATIGVPYLTAAHAVLSFPNLNGRHVLVQGGAGAVGSAAIQLSALRGATVVATVSGPDKADIAAMSHPDAILNYRLPDFTDRLAESAADGFDLVTEVDLGHNISSYASHLRRGAKVVAYASDGSSAPVPVRTLMFHNVTLHCFVVYLLPRAQLDKATTLVQSLIEGGQKVVLPAHQYSLSEVAEAHDAVQSGLVGRAILRLV